jgi:hypothetical protein
LASAILTNLKSFLQESNAMARNIIQAKVHVTGIA